MMQQPILIYCYDAYCGWCYGFSNTIKQIEEKFYSKLQFEVLSGGMVTPDKPIHISTTANYILQAYPQVEALAKVTFGNDYLWHLQNADESDWFPDSTKPAIALAIIKELLPLKQIAFAADIQYSLFVEGRDLTDNEAYRHLLEKYAIDVDDFYKKLSSEKYLEKAKYEFQLCKQLKVTGFPCVYIQTADDKFFVVAKGFTSFETLVERIEMVLGQ